VRRPMIRGHWGGDGDGGGGWTAAGADRFGAGTDGPDGGAGQRRRRLQGRQGRKTRANTDGDGSSLGNSESASADIHWRARNRPFVVGQRGRTGSSPSPTRVSGAKIRRR